MIVRRRIAIFGRPTFSLSGCMKNAGMMIRRCATRGYYVLSRIYSNETLHIIPHAAILVRAFVHCLVGIILFSELRQSYRPNQAKGQATEEPSQISSGRGHEGLR